jgi:hypothetical protein
MGSVGIAHDRKGKREEEKDELTEREEQSRRAAHRRPAGVRQ